MHILLVDHHDSFTFNLYQQIQQLGAKVTVVEDEDLESANLPAFDAVILSPGPKKPSDYPRTLDIIRQYEKPILGVCLGHQAICEVFGAKIVHAPKVMHGKSSEIFHAGTSLFKDLPQGFKAARYHSLVAASVPPDLELLAWTSDEIIMAVKHKLRPIFGIQFHPESFLTEEGDRLMQNFLNFVREHSKN